MQHFERHESLLTDIGDRFPQELDEHIHEILKAQDIKDIWNDLTVCTVSLPDQVANTNFGIYGRYTRPKAYCSLLLDSIYKNTENLCNHQNMKLSDENLSFICAVIGKISLIGHAKMVCTNFIARVLSRSQDKCKKTLITALQLPLVQTDDYFTSRLQIYVEVIYLPLFRFLDLTSMDSNIEILLTRKIAYSNESFRHIFNTSLIDNYNCPKNEQYKYIKNCLTYLHRIRNIDEKDDSSPLLSILLLLTSTWTNKLQILFRTPIHNLYITRALVMCFKFAKDNELNELKEHAESIQSMIIKGVHVYLDRASADQRNFAVCVGETLFPDLVNVIKSKNQKSKTELTEIIEFGIDLDDDTAELKRLYFATCENFHVPRESEPSTSHQDVNGGKEDNKVKKLSEDNLDSDDDLEPYIIEEDVEEDLDITEISEKTPNYLRDCINGLVDNETPRCTQLCLKRSTELIERLCPPNSKQDTSDSINDVAVEFASVLLHLEDKYEMENFSSYRLKSLTSLCNAAPTLVAKFLIDEFNKEGKSCRHQLDILQVLVSSAGHLSREQSSNFVRYAPLYFYGIAHQLRVSKLGSTHEIISKLSERNASKNLIRLMSVQSVEEVKSEPSLSKRINTCLDLNDIDDGSIDESYLLARILFSLSLILKSCLNQPISKRLSTDLAELLSNYVKHPDTGVKQAVFSCLEVIQQCNPKLFSLFFGDNSNEKLL